MASHQQKEPVFQPGDRVAERPKASAIPGLSPESQQRIAQYRSQRYGTVVSTFIKSSDARSKRVMKIPFVKVLWDGHASPSDHAQMRLIHEEKLAALLETYSTAIGG